MKKELTTALIAISLFATPSMAIVGAGVHWGFDFSTNMSDSNHEDILRAKDLLDTTMLGDFKDSSFLFISRSGFERTPINFGGKVFFDLLPVELEASVNMGIWQYDGKINYLSIDTSAATLSYKEESITIENLGGASFFGVNKTPYGKFQTDVTIKKSFKKIPIITPSFGAGASAHFATPVLSADLVNRALNIGSNISEIDPTTLTSTEAMKRILTEITEGAKKPKVGMHIVAGIQVKPPVIPLGIYVDGKYLIMFDDIESGVGVTTKGFLVNAGIMLKI